MSVHQESLDINSKMESADEAPELEYTAYRHDSLSMFGAAIGGAVLGMLLTLLVLAIINGGTLSFTGGDRLAIMSETMTRIDENVGAVAYNVEVVAQQAAKLQTEIAATQTSLQAAIDTNTADVATIQTNVDDLANASGQFATFLVALDDALANASEAMEAVRGAGE
jgi:cytochrome c556